jgi:putative membrane protein
MFYLIQRIAVIALALYVTAYLMPGITVSGWQAVLVAAVVLGLLNAIVRPVLILLTLPISIVTLGLFIFVINATLFYLAAQFVDGFSVSSFGSALLGSIIVSIVSTIGNQFIADK